MKQIIGLILLLVMLGIIIIWAKGKTPGMSGNNLFNFVTPTPLITPTLAPTATPTITKK